MEHSENSQNEIISFRIVDIDVFQTCTDMVAFHRSGHIWYAQRSHCKKAALNRGYLLHKEH